MDKIQKANDEGIKPVIILDEFQYLRGIKLFKDEDTVLIKELFKFFIALTKQNNLAHVICLTSDSYYMEDLYSETKLTNTSRFYHIKHLSKPDIEYWLGETENCPKEMVDEIWEHLGGSVWEIWMVFVAYKNNQNWRSEMKDLIENKFGVMTEYFTNELADTLKPDFLRVTKVLSENGEYEKKIGENLSELIKAFVDRDIWFFDARSQLITPNSKSQQMAMKIFLQKAEKSGIEV
jgi:AAA+ ATPase superfamily predicted ATPase